MTWQQLELNITIDCCTAAPSDQGLEVERSDTDHADFCRHQVAESVEPLHIGLQVAGLLVIAVAALKQTAKHHVFNQCILEPYGKEMNE